jgi:DNA-binding Lrp family transcriptional regulator
MTARARICLNKKTRAQIVEIKEAHTVYGVYEIIARIEAETMEDLKNIISWKVRRLNKVRSTLTMITY